jgi:hypothetical protein
MIARLAVPLLAVLAMLLPQQTSAQSTAPEAVRLVRIPFVTHSRPANTCPVTGATYAMIPVVPPPTDRTPAKHADFNLGLRSWQAASAALSLVDYAGNADWDAPQLRGLFADRRVAGFTSTHQVYDWNWKCGADGCPTAPITSPQVTLLGVATRVGERLHPPSRGQEIYGGGYIALVLYAEERRLTLKYTRDDNVVGGYTIQLEGLCVDPSLLRLYRQADAAGRAYLPALKNGQALGTAASGEIRAAVRDCGAYLDPRSRKDWWQQ